MSKYAILMNSGTDEVGPTVNGFQYALTLDDAGNDVAVYLDGGATKWPEMLDEKPSHPINDYFDELRDRGLVVGACGFCASAFDGADGCREAGIEVLGDEDTHAPDLGALAADGYQFMTVG